MTNFLGITRGGGDTDKYLKKKGYVPISNRRSLRYIVYTASTAEVDGCNMLLGNNPRSSR